MFQHWEEWGYRRGVHWDIGHRPPARLGWPLPLVVPESWENIITFYTGAIGQIISQDRVGTSNSKSFDYIDIDEAKFVDFERLKDETFPANRGQQREFGDLPFHHGMLITSDMPVTKKGSWFLRYEQDSDRELITTIEALVADELQTQQRIAQGDTIFGEMFSSDGLHSYGDDAEIAELIVNNPIAKGCDLLVDYALGNGGRDNVSVALVLV